MTTIAVPAMKDLKDTLTSLLGLDVQVAPGAPRPSVGGGSLVGHFVDDNQQSVLGIVVDLPLAARMGAAIGLVPPGGADAAIEDKVLPGNLRENTSEVLNVVGALFNHAGGPHLRLHGVIGHGDELPAGLRAMIEKSPNREDIWIDVSRYGRGVMAMILA